MTSKTVGIVYAFGRATRVGALLASLALTGCSERNAVDPNERIASSAAPLGEAACATLPATATFTEPGSVLDYSSPTSYNISGCYRAVIVDAFNYGQSSNPTGAVVAWNAATPTTQESCENAWVAAKVYKQTAGAWEAIGSSSASGTWFQGLCIPPSLVWSTADVPSGASYRFAASARVSASGVTRSVRVFAERSQCVANDPRSPGLNPADPTTATSFARAAAPLYTGSGASQRPVASGVIDPAHLAVVQGKVVDSAGNAVSCAEVSVVGAPRYGVTHTFSDGSFAMVVNGDGRVTVRVRQTGYFSSDRTVDTAWNRFAIAAPIRLMPLPANADYVSVTQAGATVAGALETDAQGTRQGVLIVPPGTHATVSGGVAQDNYKIAIKEVTNLQNYPARDAMPATLPPQSAFTYAMQLVVQGAEEKDVAFDKPIPFYVENFIISTKTTANDTVGFPIGEAVPVGRYDRALGKWVAEENGVVLKLVGTNTSGEAKIDFIPNAGEAGTGADNTASLGTTSTELQRLAARYCPGGNCSGKQLWRFTTNHFSAWDVNWGWGPPPNAGPPSTPPPPPPPPICEQAGSIVECQTQVLREKVPVTATPFNLVYSSGRQAGSSRRLSIPVTGATVPAGVKRIDLEVEVGGRLIRPNPALQAPNIVANQIYQFEWDGKDVAGRRLYGPQPVTVRMGYVYEGSYVRTPRFGYSGNGVAAAISGSVPRFEATLWQAPWSGLIGSVDARYAGLGGWTLDVHHQLDSFSGVVYLGDGTTMDAPPSELNTIAGDVTSTAAPPPMYPATPVSATTAQIADVSGAATAPDGTTYIASLGQVHRVGNGLIDTILGCPGTDQSQCKAVRLAVAPDGDVYMSTSRDCIQKIQVNNGMALSTVAGVCGTAGFQDGSASVARFNTPKGIAFAPDGTLYIADTFNQRIRILRDGVVSSLPGTTGSVPANLSVAVGSEGSVYFNTQANIMKYAVDGSLSTYVSVAASAMAIGPDGLLYVGSSNLVRRVNADKTLTTVVGNGDAQLPTGLPTEHRLPTQSTMNGVDSIGFDALGAIYATHASPPNLLRKTELRVAKLATNPRAVSKDGQQIFVFDGAGKHLKTLDARTGAAVYTFGYTPSGALASVTDVSGRQTTITRDASGKATAIVAPELQQTTLTIDAAADPAVLKNVIRPDGTSYVLEYEPGAMLKSMLDPKGGAESTGKYTFHYTNGLLDQDTDPRIVAVAQTLSRVDFPTGTTVTHTSPGGKQTTYKTEYVGTRQTSTVTHPDQIPVIQMKQLDGALSFQASSNSRYYDTVLTRADGTKFYSKQGLETSSGTTYTTEQLTELPSGLKRLEERTIETTRNATTGTIESQTVTTKLNGNAAVEIYNGATRTLTSQSRQGRESTVTFDAQGRVYQTRTTGGVPMGSDFLYVGVGGRLSDILKVDTQIRRRTHFDYFS